jgi:hypothetical protein
MMPVIVVIDDRNAQTLATRVEKNSHRALT